MPPRVHGGHEAPAPRQPDVAAPAGLDEAGRGCLFGPVVAAAVVLPEGFRPKDLPGLTDSKLLSPAQRQGLAARIRHVALAWGLGVAWPAEIARRNILWATMAAMGRAVDSLGMLPAGLLIDGNRAIPPHLLRRNLPQTSVVGGDLTVPAISAASILAKTFRDKLLVALDRRYPGYGLAGHKGYGTAEHRACLERLGATRLHRQGFKGVGPVPAVAPQRLGLWQGLA